MYNTISENTKQTIIERALFGDNITSLAQEFHTSRSSIYRWLNHARYKEKYNLDNLLSTAQSKRSIERMNKKLEILSRAPCSTDAPINERYRYIESIEEKYGVTVTCEAMNVNKSSYLNYKLRGKRENTIYHQREIEAKPLIEEIYFESGRTYGVKRVYAELKNRGYDYGEKLIRKVMHENGMFSIISGAKKRYLQSFERKENKLKQEFNVSRPNEVWVSDVTETKIKNKRIFICIILDLYSRKVVAYKFSSKNSTQLTRATLKDAYNKRKPEGLLFHSDRGSNYTSRTFRTFVKDLGLVSSYSASAKPHDNAVIESFNKTLKNEEIYVRDYHSERHFKESVSKYLDYYNTKRIHEYNNFMSPDKKGDFFPSCVNL